MDIDIVVPWVNGNDPKWIQKKQNFSGGAVTEDRDSKNVELNGNEKYRDSGTLLYVLRSIEKYAPWIHHVFLITDEQTPDWINEKFEKLTIVDHKDYIPSRWLPTFSSNPIILNVHRIPRLSEHFILFNDDMILNREVKSTDFFSQSGKPVDIGVYSVIPSFEKFSHLILNNTNVINKYFSKWNGIKRKFSGFFNFKYGKSLIRTVLALPWDGISGFYNPHMPIPYLKSTFETVWKKEGQWLSDTSSHKFRSDDDLTDWVMRYWQIQSGDFKAGSIKFSKYYLQNETQKIINDLKTSKHHMICINDTPMTKDADIDLSLKKALELKFDRSSKFEK